MISIHGTTSGAGANLSLLLRNHVSAAIAGLAAVCVSAPVFAQTATSESVLESVTVTAQRRAEDQQSVPISITTLSARQLEAGGVSALEDLTVATPGLVMTRQLRGSTPFLRGVGATSVTPGNESPVAQYVDGIYYMSPVGNIFSFNNVERIEVLKGPQGTLFGRNATGGLINVITSDPEVEPGFKLSVSRDDYETNSVSAYATGGAGEVAADIAIMYLDQDKGYGKNLNTGKDVNLQNERAVRSKVLWTPTDGDRITFSIDWSENKGDLGLTRSIFPTSRGVGNTPLRGDQYDTQATFPTYVKSFPSWGASLKYERTFDWGSFQSLTAHRDQKSQTFLDQDSTPIPFVNVEVNEQNKWQQQEFLLVGNAGKLDWTTGIFLFNATSGYSDGGLKITSGLVPSLNTTSYPKQETRSYAAFAQSTYAVTDTTKVTAGLRYTEDQRSYTSRQIANAGHPAGAGTVLATNFDEKSFPKLTYRFAVDQQLGDSALIYASFNRGFKSGIFNTGIINGLPVNPETLDAIEIGLKSELFDHRVRLNLAAYDYDYEDIQLQRVVTGASVIFNAAKGAMRGLDVEAIFVPPTPVGELQLTLGASLIDTEYKEFPNGPTTVPNATGGNATVATDLAGNDMIRAPKYTATAGIDYELPIGDDTLAMSVNYFKNDGFFWEPDNRLEQEPYEVLNAQVSYGFGAEERVRVRVFGKNLTDAVYASYVSAGAVGDLVGSAPPRTYGVGFDFKY